MTSIIITGDHHVVALGKELVTQVQKSHHGMPSLQLRFHAFETSSEALSVKAVSLRSQQQIDRQAPFQLWQVHLLLKKLRVRWRSPKPHGAGQGGGSGLVCIVREKRALEGVPPGVCPRPLPGLILS